jgi:hypothetical protein
MQVKIGGFAAFCIACVVVGGIERITSSICVSRIGRGRKLPKQSLFWKELAHQVEALRTETPDISIDDLRTKLKEKQSPLYESALMECETPEEIERFTMQWNMKLEALGEPAK